MSLDRYASNASAIAEELLAELSTDDVEILRGLMAERGVRGWLDWLDAHASAVATYIERTPSARRKMRLDQQTLLLYRYAGYLLARQAAELLRAADGLYPGLSYRTMTAQAATLAYRLELDPFHWPFDDPNPFD